MFAAESTQKQMDKLQDEMIRLQTKYQRELEHLERENKELRKQLLLYKANKVSSKKVKVRLITVSTFRLIWFTQSVVTNSTFLRDTVGNFSGSIFNNYEPSYTWHGRDDIIQIYL